MKSKSNSKRHGKRASELKTDNMLVRLQPAEKEAFQNAADLVGLPLSNWVRMRLRRAAMRELEAASMPIAFLKDLGTDNDNG